MTEFLWKLKRLLVSRTCFLQKKKEYVKNMTESLYILAEVT